MTSPLSSSSTSFLPSPPHSPTVLTHPSRSSSTTPKPKPTSSAVFIDPFAGNAKATQSPPIYYKRSSRPRTPDRVGLQPVQLQTPPQDLPAVNKTNRRVSFQPSPFPSPSAPDYERRIWEDAVDTMISDATGEIDLQAKFITSIPPLIGDAAKLVVLKKNRMPSASSSRALDRTRSAPAAFVGSAARQSMGRSKTTMLGPALFSHQDPVVSTPSKAAEIQLLLGSNSISKLPTELFRLSGLTVLSLRSNSLTHIPPAISSLVNLEELNLSNNSITYMPAETTQLKNLKKLLLNANPLLPLPTATDAEKRIFSAIKTLRESGVQSLQEIALSVLLAPSICGELTSQTNLEAHYDLPLPVNYLHRDILHKINAALPSSSRTRITPPSGPSSSFQQFSKASIGGLLPSAPVQIDDIPQTDRYSDASSNARFNACPAPHHLLRGVDDALFVDHAEERYEWVTGLASDAVVSDLPGGRVPILWRGCSWGCLDFLEEKDVVNEDESWDDDEFELDP